MNEIIIRGGTIVTVDPSWHIAAGDLACRDGDIVQVGGHYTPLGNDYEIVDATGCVVMPGLVQSHVHMCQSLARGRADDVALLDWLTQVIWPYEAALGPQDMRVAAELAAAELLLGGTTSILDMGTVHHADALFEVAARSGLRATIGKAMMDLHDPCIPPALNETTESALRESARLCETWHDTEDGRLRYAYAPRFAISCTDDLLRQTAIDARDRDARVHTHASENRDEVREIKRRTGMDNVAYLHDCGLTGHDVTLAHCVWLTERERGILGETGTHVAHCPSSNLKLASGVAEIPELIEAGVGVSLGADGGPCNNNLDGFVEMRLAALLHKPRCGPKAMPAPLVLRMATLGGAAALGLHQQIGSLEVGKLADVITVDIGGPHVVPTPDPHAAVVYGCRASDVRHVVAAGQLVVRDRQLLTMDLAHILRQAATHAADVFARVRDR